MILFSFEILFVSSFSLFTNYLWWQIHNDLSSFVYWTKIHVKRNETDTKSIYKFKVSCAFYIEINCVYKQLYGNIISKAKCVTTEVKCYLVSARDKYF